jgi:hypothetical protein
MTQCTQCGHENNSQYRFCGVCGAPLGPPPARTSDPGQRRFTPPVSGPSFLGLGDERTRDLDYLLEDEAPRGHGRLYLALLLLLSSAGLLAWHWQRDGYPWAGLIPRQVANSAPASPPPVPAEAPGASTETPVISLPPQAPATTPSTGEAPQAPASGSSAGSTAAADPTTAAAKSPDQMPESQTAEHQTNEAQTPQAQLSGSKTAPSSGEPAAKPSTAPPGDDEAEAAESIGPKRTDIARAAPMAKSIPKPQPTIPAISPDDQLVADGEKYLYGRGGRANCDLAQRNLLIAARQSNPKAQTLLGAMYATGHCVNRDLPTAYRWFAQALHGDPGNSRVQRDLEVLWKQMTPEERQLASRSR